MNPASPLATLPSDRRRDSRVLDTLLSVDLRRIPAALVDALIDALIDCGVRWLLWLLEKDDSERGADGPETRNSKP
jgi:hypothetical protein